ncbi:MAG: hypothetical protein ACK5MQ_02435 [Pikeienuella sp.]
MLDLFNRAALLQVDDMMIAAETRVFSIIVHSGNTWRKRPMSQAGLLSVYSK